MKMDLFFCLLRDIYSLLLISIVSIIKRYFTHPMFQDIKEKAEALTKQPLPEPFDNTEFGFATPRG